MNNIFVNKDIEELGLSEGDILFYTPEDDLYEYCRKDGISKEGLTYSISESIKYSIDYLKEYLDNGDLKEFETVSEEEDDGWKYERFHIYSNYFPYFEHLLKYRIF